MRTLLVTYYDGVDGDTKIRLIRGELDEQHLKPEDLGLKDCDFTTIQVMYDDCNLIAVAPSMSTDALLLYDITPTGREGSEEQGYHIVEVEDIEVEG